MTHKVEVLFNQHSPQDIARAKELTQKADVANKNLHGSVQNNQKADSEKKDHYNKAAAANSKLLKSLEVRRFLHH